MSIKIYKVQREIYIRKLWCAWFKKKSKFFSARRRNGKKRVTFEYCKKCAHQRYSTIYFPLFQTRTSSTYNKKKLLPIRVPHCISSILLKLCNSAERLSYQGTVNLVWTAAASRRAVIEWTAKYWHSFQNKVCLKKVTPFVMHLKSLNSD